MKRKVVHLTSVHRAHDVRILYKQCKSLAEEGFDVSLIAPHANVEYTEGVRIRAVEIPKSRRERITRVIPQLLKYAIDEDASIYHFHDPELIPVGWRLKRLGKKVIYDVHEDVPKQIASKSWIPIWMRGSVGKITGSIESWASGWLDGVVTATQPIAARFPGNKTIVVNNYPIVEKESIKVASDSFHLVYHGGITADRGILDVLDAIELLPSEMNVKLLLAGKFFSTQLEKIARAHSAWSKVDFLGWQSRDQIKELLTRSQVGLVPLHAISRYMESQPVKLYEYMAAGIPVIASDFPIWRKIIAESNCGLMVKPNDPAALSKLICWIYSHEGRAIEMGNNGRAEILENYNWATEANKLIALYLDLIHEDTHDCWSETSVYQGSNSESCSIPAA